MTPRDFWAWWDSHPKKARESAVIGMMVRLRTDDLDVIVKEAEDYEKGERERQRQRKKENDSHAHDGCENAVSGL